MPPSKKDLKPLHRWLRRGDYTRIARKLNGKYTRQYIALIANGTGGRTNDEIMAELIAQAKQNKLAERRTRQDLAKLRP